MKRKLFFLLVVLMIGFSALLLYQRQQHNRYQRTPAIYQVPEVTLLTHRGESVALKEYLEPDFPLLLEFVFTSCTTLCTDQSVKFSNLQRRIAQENPVRLVSITIDPENDTPEVLARYLRQFDARPGWDFLTGKKEDIEQVMQAFDITMAKMVTLESSLLVRYPQSGQWVKIDGRLNGEDFWREYQLLSGN